MMLDKKTTEEIEILSLECLSIDTEESINIRKNKVWVSQESLIKIFEDDSITCFEDLRDFILSELKGDE